MRCFPFYLPIPRLLQSRQSAVHLGCKKKLAAKRTPLGARLQASRRTERDFLRNVHKDCGAHCRSKGQCTDRWRHGAETEPGTEMERNILRNRRRCAILSVNKFRKELP